MAEADGLLPPKTQPNDDRYEEGSSTEETPETKAVSSRPRGARGKYRRKVFSLGPLEPQEVRLSTKSNLVNCFRAAHKILEEQSADGGGGDTGGVLLTASGNAIGQAVRLCELLKRSIRDLHQVTDIGTVVITDEYLPLEEGLDVVTRDRNVSFIRITLSVSCLDTTDPGYQAPLDFDSLRPEDFEGVPLRSPPRAVEGSSKQQPNTNSSMQGGRPQIAAEGLARFEAHRQPHPQYSAAQQRASVYQQFDSGANRLGHHPGGRFSPQRFEPARLQRPFVPSVGRPPAFGLSTPPFLGRVAPQQLPPQLRGFGAPAPFHNSPNPFATPRPHQFSSSAYESSSTRGLQASPSVTPPLMGFPPFNSPDNRPPLLGTPRQRPPSSSGGLLTPTDFRPNNFFATGPPGSPPPFGVPHNSSAPLRSGGSQFLTPPLVHPFSHLRHPAPPDASPISPRGFPLLLPSGHQPPPPPHYYQTHNQQLDARLLQKQSHYSPFPHNSNTSLLNPQSATPSPSLLNNNSTPLSPLTFLDVDTLAGLISEVTNSRPSPSYLPSTSPNGPSARRFPSPLYNLLQDTF